MGRYRYITRLCLIALLAVAGFIIIRSFMIPPSFGLHGDYKYMYYRADALKEQESLPVVYQGTGKCVDCHEMKQYIKIREGHADIACETCHGFQQSHSEDTKIRVPNDLSLQLCLRCHQYQQSRPENIPQIKNFNLHIQWALKHGFSNPEDLSRLNEFFGNMKEMSEFTQWYPLCVDCHNPHAPRNPKVTIPNILKITRG